MNAYYNQDFTLFNVSEPYVSQILDDLKTGTRFSACQVFSYNGLIAYVKGHPIIIKCRQARNDPMKWIVTNDERRLVLQWLREFVETKTQKVTDIALGELQKKLDPGRFCKICSSKNVTYYELQTRNFTERMIVKNKCLDCGNGWVETYG